MTCTILFWYAAACSKVSRYGCSYDAPHAGHMHFVSGISYDAAHEFWTGVPLHDRTDHVERSSFHIQDVHMELHAHMMPRMHSVWDEILEEVPYCDDHLACAFRDTSQHPVNVLMCMKSKGVSFSE